jgi:hypothetical protein
MAANVRVSCVALGKLIVVVLILLPACASIRPVVKIGLLAPFEGLYRRTGYTALEALRAAIAEQAPAAVDVLPLALDDANDPTRARRAAQKLRSDAGVRAVVGPLSLATQASVAPMLRNSGLFWVLPDAIDPTGGFAPPDAPPLGATALVMTVAEAASKQGSTRLVIAGWLPTLAAFTQALLPAAASLPVVVSDDVNTVQPSDAVLHLGNPDQVAADFNRLRTRHPAIPYYVGPQGEDPVFVERAQVAGPLYWVTWVDADYAQWAAIHGSASPAAYRTYRAAQGVLAFLQAQPAPHWSRWEAQFFRVTPDGTSEPFVP